MVAFAASADAVRRRSARVNREGASGGDLFGPGAGAELGEDLFRALDAALGLGDAIARHVAACLRVIALLARSRVVLEERVEALEVLFGGIELGSRGRDLGAGGVDLRLRLSQVFGARRCLHQPQLRFGGGAFRLGAVDRQLHVASVESEHDLPGLHAIAFLDRQGQHPAADFRGQSCLGGFNVTRDAHAVRGRLGGAGGNEEQKRK